MCWPQLVSGLACRQYQSCGGNVDEVISLLLGCPASLPSILPRPESPQATPPCSSVAPRRWVVETSRSMFFYVLLVRYKNVLLVQYRNGYSPNIVNPTGDVCVTLFRNFVFFHLCRSYSTTYACYNAQSLFPSKSLTDEGLITV